MGYKEVALAQGPAALFMHGEASGTAAIDAVAANNGVLTGTFALGAAGLLRGDAGTALDFTSQLGYVALPNIAALHPGNTFGIEFWLVRTQIGETMALWSGNVAQDLYFGFTVGDTIRVRSKSTGDVCVTTTTLTDTTSAHCIQARKSGAVTTIRVDGVAQPVTTTDLTLVGGSAVPYIGAEVGPDEFFAGKLQATALYAFAPTDAQFDTTYHAGLAQFKRTYVVMA